jgi:hypothetical protein
MYPNIISKFTHPLFSLRALIVIRPMTYPIVNEGYISYPFLGYLYFGRKGYFKKLHTLAREMIWRLIAI